MMKQLILAMGYSHSTYSQLVWSQQTAGFHLKPPVACMQCLLTGDAVTLQAGSLAQKISRAGRVMSDTDG
jgi:hypothetical protein